MTKHSLIGASLLAASLAGCATPMPPPGATPGPARTTAIPANWPAARSPAAIADPATETTIARLIARMTLEQKVGQVIQGDIGAVTPADLARYPLGSILAGGNSGPYGNERADAATWKKLVDEFRAASRLAGAGVPILFGVDAVHGHSNVPGATIFPHNIGLGAAHDPDLIRRIGAATAAEIAASGIEWTFAPTLAVPGDFRWGRTYEGYAADPALVASYARAMVLGLQGPLEAGRPLPSDKVAATAKHFLADGGTLGGKDQGDAVMSEAELVAGHAPGYPAAIDAGALTVMASFSSWNGRKHHGNRSLLTDVLKGRMGFEGLVVGDWNGHAQVTGCTATDCPASLDAGLDLYMAPDSWKGLFDSLVGDVRDGAVPMARLEDAVRRVLRVKAKLGLLQDNPVERGDTARLGSAAHLALAREAVAKSLVLLKNEGGLLPIGPGSRVLVTGPGADDMAMQAGGWTISWQGTDTTAKDFPNGITVGRALVAAVEAAGGSARLDPAGADAGPADIAVVVYGERPYAEGYGDVPDLAFRPVAGEDALVARLKARGLKVVSVFLTGRPLFAGGLMNASDAFVAAWLPGTQGQGVADVLVAGRDGRPRADFTGQLPFAWPDDARSPVTAPLFREGYGLSYARPGRVGPVNADPRVDLAVSRSAERYFARGAAVAPWRLATDAAVTRRAVDLRAQEDAQRFTWTGPGGIALEGPPVDLSHRLDRSWVLALDWRVDARGSGPFALTMDGAELDLTRWLANQPLGSAAATRIPLSCFAARGADLREVGTPLRLRGDNGLAIALREARIEASGQTLACP